MNPSNKDQTQSASAPSAVDLVIESFHQWDVGKAHIGIEGPSGAICRNFEYPIEDFYAERLELLAASAGSSRELDKKRRAAADLSLRPHWGDIDGSFDKCQYVLSRLQEIVDRENDQEVLSGISTVLFDLIYCDNLRGEQESEFVTSAARLAAALLKKEVIATRGEANPECILLRLANERLSGVVSLKTVLTEVMHDGSALTLVEAINLLHEKKLSLTGLDIEAPDSALAAITLGRTEGGVNRAFSRYIEYFKDDSILQKVLCAASVLGRYGPAREHTIGVLPDFEQIEFLVDSYTSKDKEVEAYQLEKIASDMESFDSLSDSDREKILISWYVGLLPRINPIIQSACAKAIAKKRTDTPIQAELPTISALLNCPAAPTVAANALLHVLANSPAKYEGVRHAVGRIKSYSDLGAFAAGTAAYAKLRHQTASPRSLLLEVEVGISGIVPRSGLSRTILSNCIEIVPQLFGRDKLSVRDFRTLRAITNRKLAKLMTEHSEEKELIAELSGFLAELPGLDLDSAEHLGRFLSSKDASDSNKNYVMASLEANLKKLPVQLKYALWLSLQKSSDSSDEVEISKKIFRKKLWEPMFICQQIANLGSGLFSAQGSTDFLSELSTHLKFAVRKAKNPEELLEISGYCVASAQHLKENRDDCSHMKVLSKAFIQVARILQRKANSLRVI